ncbi:MAG: hypothetical protein M3Y44_12065 [Actinomycetota bacterium]|nr:hypothetical protein [Actinomycetota bacterium]
MPVSSGSSKSGSTGPVAVVVGAPLAAPAGVEEHRITGPDIGARCVQGGGDVLDRDHLTGFQPGDTAGRGDVGQDAPCHDLRQGVDAEPLVLWSSAMSPSR